MGVEMEMEMEMQVEIEMEVQMTIKTENIWYQSMHKTRNSSNLRTLITYINIPTSLVVWKIKENTSDQFYGDQFYGDFLS